jgi:hypothetical protein
MTALGLGKSTPRQTRRWGLTRIHAEGAGFHGRRGDGTGRARASSRTRWTSEVRNTSCQKAARASEAAGAAAVTAPAYRRELRRRRITGSPALYARSTWAATARASSIGSSTAATALPVASRLAGNSTANRPSGDETTRIECSLEVRHVPQHRDNCLGELEIAAG